MHSAVALREILRGSRGVQKSSQVWYILVIQQHLFFY